MPTNVQLSKAGSRPATTTNSGIPNGYAVATVAAHPQLVGNSAATMGSARGGIANFQITRSASTSFSALQALGSPPVVSSSIGPLSAGSFTRTFSSLLSPLAVRACDYEPDAGDELDLELAEHLKELRPELSSALHVSRQARGRYEIEGRRVILLRELDDDDEEGDIVVQEEGTTDPDSFTPLETYLQQSAHVAAFMTANGSQHRKDLTFGDARIPNDTDPFTARLMCMQLACEQADLRQTRPHETSSTEEALQKPIKDTEKPRTWWESWEAFFRDGRPARREERGDGDTSEEEGCY